MRGSRAAERSSMEPSESRSILPLEILATSLVMRLSLNELEWLWRELAKRTEEKRRKESKAGGEPSVLAGNRGVWELNRARAL
jgi:hypothetical protein